MNTWGKHLILDVINCDYEAMINATHIMKFAKELVEAIDMVPYGEPQIIHFGSGNKSGYTLVQLIETSNITAHFAEEDRSIYLDVFSCKDFNEEDVLKVFVKYFLCDPNDISYKVLQRGSFAKKIDK
jgi:S-adenosylmethionine/arginine decarboxylase-like enzyme